MPRSRQEKQARWEEQARQSEAEHAEARRLASDPADEACLVDDKPEDYKDASVAEDVEGVGEIDNG